MPKEPLFKTIRAVLGRYFKHRGPLFARGIAYSFLLGSMPFVLLSVAAASYFYQNTPQINQGLDRKLHEFLPQSIATTLGENIYSLADGWAEIGVIGVLILVFVSKGMFDSIGGGLSVVMGPRHREKMLLSHLYSLILTLLTIVIFIVASLDNMIIDLVITYTNITVPPASYTVLMRLFSFLLLTLILVIIYLVYAPVKIKMRYTFQVSAIVALIWYLIGASGKYVIIFTGRQKLIYGVFAGTALFLVWLQIFAHMILLGGIVIAHKSQVYKVVTERTASDAAVPKEFNAI